MAGIKDQIRNNGIEALLLLVLAGVMLYFIRYKDFWYDEIAILSFVASGKHLPDLLHIYLHEESSNLPLYAMLIRMVYYALPAKKLWLLLPGILMTLIGTGLLVVFVKKRFGRIGALWLLLCCITSATVVRRMGLELRAYSLMYFSVCLLLFVCMKQFRNKGIAFAARLLASVSLIFSHYFGVLFFALWFLASLVQLVRKRRTWEWFLPQLVAGLLFLPWLIAVRGSAANRMEGFWIGRPALHRIPDTFGYLMGSTIPQTAVYAFFSVVVFLWILRKRRYISFESFCLFLPYIMVGGIFVYSRFLSTGGGLFQEKYFIAALPCMLYVMGVGAALLFQLLRKHKSVPAMAAVTILLLLVLRESADTCIDQAGEHYTRYSGAAEYLTAQGDLGAADTMLLLTYFDYLKEYTVTGWYDFYLRRQGETAANLQYIPVRALQETMDALDADIRKVYVFSETDQIRYDESGYHQIWQDGYYCLTVYER